MRIRVLLVTLVLLSACPSRPTGSIAQAQPGSSDPIAKEVATWSARLNDKSRTEELWVSLTGGAADGLAMISQALADGRRLFATERLAAVRQSLAAGEYLLAHPNERADMAAFENEWKRMSGVLGLENTGASSDAPRRPALARALDEAAASQLRVYYDSSLAYGRNTTASSGVTYLGVAQAQREWLTLSPSLPVQASGRAPAVRSIRAEIDALQAELLTAYRPPASIDRHPEFIAASANLKEARELDGASRHYAALLRYLQAASRIERLRPAPAELPDADAVAARLRAGAARLTGDVDHTIARMFVEQAEHFLAHGDPKAPSPIPAAVASSVLPKYFAALEPRSAAPPAPAATVTITLVRWPYT
jgi:hypothetical protein